jgi:uncharacterized protein
MVKEGFQIFVKPVGAHCNLNCRYCYYINKTNQENDKITAMDQAIATEYVRKNIEASSGIVNFTWHGGEPLLAGIDFYRNMIALQKQYNRQRKKIINGVQTNGTLINEAWCIFFRKEHFLVGISIDGTEEIHDSNRVTKGGSPSFSRVLRGYRLLQQYGIKTEILCVVNKNNVKALPEIYRYFKSLGAVYMTFLPLVEKVNNDCAVNLSVPSLEFGIFMSAIFDEWMEQDIGKIKVQLFEEACRPAFGQDHTLCIFKRTCGGVPVLEQNGDMYSCDHYVDSGHLIGNVLDSSIENLLVSSKQQEFGNKKLIDLPDYCKKCQVLDMCNGECPKNRFIESPYGEPGLNYLCEGYKYFFNHCLPFVKAVSSVWKQK